MAKRKPNLRLRDEVLPELEAWGYITKHFTEYHVRVTNEESENEVDVWPTSGKCMQVGAHSTRKFTNWGELKRFLDEVLDQE